MTEVVVFLGADESVKCDVSFHQLVDGDIGEHIIRSVEGQPFEFVGLDRESGGKLLYPSKFVHVEIHALLGCGLEVDGFGAEKLLQKKVFGVVIRRVHMLIPSDQREELKDNFELPEWDGFERGVEDVGGLEHFSGQFAVGSGQGDQLDYKSNKILKRSCKLRLVPPDRLFAVVFV